MDVANCLRGFHPRSKWGCMSLLRFTILLKRRTPRKNRVSTPDLGGGTPENAYGVPGWRPPQLRGSFRARTHLGEGHYGSAAIPTLNAGPAGRGKGRSASRLVCAARKPLGLKQVGPHRACRKSRPMVELTDLPALCLATVVESLLERGDPRDLLSRTDVDLARDALALWVTSRAFREALAAPLAAGLVVRSVYVGVVPRRSCSPVDIRSLRDLSLASVSSSGSTVLARKVLDHLDRRDELNSYDCNIRVQLGPEVLDHLVTAGAPSAQAKSMRYVPLRRRLLALLGPDPRAQAAHASRLRDEHRARCVRRRDELDLALELRGFAGHSSRAAMTFASGHGRYRDAPTSPMTLADAAHFTEHAWRRRGTTSTAAAGTSTREVAKWSCDEFACVLCGARGYNVGPLFRYIYLRRCKACIAAGCFDAWRHRTDIWCVCDSYACRRKAAVGSCFALACGCVALAEEDLFEDCRG